MRIADPLKDNMYAELARRNLRRQSIRTILAAIGIIIGVIAISSMGILGNTMKMSVTESFADIGDKLMVYPAPGEETISQRQIGQIRKVGGIDRIIPLRSNAERVEYRNEETFASVYDIDEEGLVTLVELEKGRFFKSGSTDCVLGSGVAENLGATVGSKVIIDDSRLRVVGILTERGLGFDIDTDSGIFTSSDMYEKLYPDEEEGYSSVIITVDDIDELDRVQEDIEDRINKKDELIMVFATNMITESIGGVFDAISLFLMGIGSISLLVAGVSILNVMLMSTMERTKEIGVMKAVGASRRDILRMFLLEALFLGVAASLIGGLLTLGGSYMVISFIMDDAAYLLKPSNILYILEGVLFGIGTSLLGGMYPAWKASRMRPLDALRYE